MSFANINTQERKETLPNVMVLGDQTITGATINDWAKVGWREVVEVDEPAEGFRVGTYAIEELSATTCKLTVATSVNLADEAAEQAAANAAALVAYTAYQKDAAKGLLDGGKEDIQRALRGFAELTLQEINTLRTRASLANYTWEQFVNALKAKIDAQT